MCSSAHPRTAFLFIFLLILAVPFSVFAQTTTITGKVTDYDGAPLQSVSVGLKGGTAATTTKTDGTFTLAIVKKGGDVLQFSFVGYVDKEVALGTSDEVNVQLDRNEQSLNAVVVVGYGTQKRKDITGSVVSLDKQRLDQLPNTNLAQALQGAVAGLSVGLNAAGAEGNDNSIIIRGRNSIKASNSPLIILDGIPYNGSISDINPPDIASIDVLKDASAAAIYGSRGSNGVILVTTKKGSSGKPVISYDGFYGIQKISNLPDMLDPEEFYDFKKYREPNSVTLSEQAIYDAKTYPDWLDLATRDGMRTQHSLGIRGGSNNVKYYISGTYLNVGGVAVNDNFKRVSTRINLEVNVTKWLTAGTNTQLAYNNRSGLAAYFSGDYGAFNFNPLTKAYDSAGKLTVYPWPEDVFFANPLSPTLAQNKDETHKVITNNYFNIKFPFVEGLSYRLNTGIEYTSRSQSTYWGRNTRNGLQKKGELNLNNNSSKNYVIENILSYERTFNKHGINFTGLYSYQKDDFSGNVLNAEGFPNDVLTYYQADVAQLIEPSSSYSKETLISQMARINYTFNDRYLLTLTGRRDGFSGFGANKKYSFFPSVAFGWNIINEGFMGKSQLFNNLKLRLSYGSNGNQAVGAYQTLAKLSERSYVDGTATAPGYVPTSLANADLGWETTNTANIGLDFGLWSGRLQGSLDIYESKTHDLLLDRQISSVQGISTITQNIGRTSNKGIELTLTSTNVNTKDFKWTTNANMSLNRNKIVDLYGDGKNDTLNQWFLGEPINVNFGYVYDGVWQETDDLAKSPQPNTKAGYAKVRDLNEDGIINNRDRTILGNTQPDFEWGMGNTFKYKSISLYVFVHGVHGTARPNALLVDNVNSGVRYRTAVKNWWTPQNPTNEYYANMLNANIYGASIYQSDAFVRIKDISLSYDFSERVLSKIKISKLRIYANVRNAFTFTDWTGLDPELNTQQAIPLQKEYLVGINLSF